jgi:hypothetical protein
MQLLGTRLEVLSAMGDVSTTDLSLLGQEGQRDEVKITTIADTCRKLWHGFGLASDTGEDPTGNLAEITHDHCSGYGARSLGKQTAGQRSVQK